MHTFTFSGLNLYGLCLLLIVLVWVWWHWWFLPILHSIPFLPLLSLKKKKKISQGKKKKSGGKKKKKEKSSTVHYQGNDHDSSPCFTSTSFVLHHQALYLPFHLLIHCLFTRAQIVTCPDQGIYLYISLFLTWRHLVAGNLLNSNVISFSVFDTDQNFPDVCKSLWGWIAFNFQCYFFYSLNTLQVGREVQYETGGRLC